MGFFLTKRMSAGLCLAAAAWLCEEATPGLAARGGAPFALPSEASTPLHNGPAPITPSSARPALALVQLRDVPPPALPMAPAGLDLSAGSLAPAAGENGPGPAESSAPPPAQNATSTQAPASGEPTVGAVLADPAAAALKTALEAFLKAEPPSGRNRVSSLVWRKQREGVAAFYALRQYDPVWVAGGRWTAPARRLIDVLAHAGDDGLDLAAYPVPASPGGDDLGRAGAELALSEALAAYGFQASGGRVDPGQISKLIGDARSVPVARQVLVDLAIAADPVAVLQSYNPSQPGYRALRDKLAELRRERAPVARAPIPAGPPLKVGMRDPRVSLIRARFGLDLDPAGNADDLVYDTVVASAVADFQRANGLPASGVLTHRTVAALSGGDQSGLEAEIIANMERWRWLPRDMGEDRIEVNIPDFTLRLVHDETDVLRARVIVGKPTTPTPIFSNQVKYMTINPTWFVPQSIVKKEMLPKLADDPDYLTRQGYEVIQHGDQISVRQPPGDRNALGHIVFWFPNQYAVYLHDTPTRGMFGSQMRAFSHGCVRLDQPFKLAEVLLGRDNGWNEDRLRRMIGPSERWISLPKPMPIHILYFTAYVDEAGKLQLRGDLYGYSKRVKAALGLDG